MDSLILQLGIIAAATVSGVAAIFAAKAEKNSRPVGNGFAQEVLSDLLEVKTLLYRHLKDHEEKGTKNGKNRNHHAKSRSSQ